MPKICQYFLDNYGGSADQLDCNKGNLQLTGPNLALIPICGNSKTWLLDKIVPQPVFSLIYIYIYNGNTRISIEEARLKDKIRSEIDQKNISRH